jgi:hypothetical protein
VQHLNPPVASKHTMQNFDEEMAGCETGGDNQHVRRQPVRYVELAAANQNNVAVLSRRQSQQEAVPRRSIDE